MKKSILCLSGVAVLSSEEQKMVKGGAVYYCHCNGSVGSWKGTYASDGRADDRASELCSSGDGTCTKA